MGFMMQPLKNSYVTVLKTMLMQFALRMGHGIHPFQW